MVERPGLLWDDSSICARPLWEHEPKVEDIIKVFLRLGFAHNRNQLHVSVLGQGAINKAYLVQIGKDGNEKVFVMRVSLPIDPSNKIRGEVTTLQWLRRYTTLPIPRVIDFMASPDEDIGYEWIIMSHVPGQPALVKWRKMSMDQKRRLVQQIASYQHELTARSFDAIGTLQGPAPHHPGRIVDMDLCYNDHYDLDIPREPFHYTRDYFLTLIEITIPDWDAELSISLLNHEQSTAQTCQGYLDVAHRIRRLLPILFPCSSTSAEPTALRHVDLNLRNIMLGGDNTFSRIIDWEFVSTLPLRAITQPPKFLKGPDHHEKPDPDWYLLSPSDSESDDGRDNEGMNSYYWSELGKYEKTLLREVYNERMSQLNPDWERLKREGRLCNDMRKAIDCISIGWYRKWIKAWLDKIEDGDWHEKLDSDDFPRLELPD